MPVPPVVHPRVQRDGSFRRVQASHGLSEDDEGVREEVRLERSPLGMPDRREQELVGKAARVRSEEDEPVLLGHDSRPVHELGGEERTEAARAVRGSILGGERRRRLSEPRELGMRVRPARAGLSALVHERVDVGKPRRPRGGRALLPGGGDGTELVGPKLGERQDMARRVNDDLLALERGVEVRNDANLPARGVPLAVATAERERLRRRELLAALAEGTRLDVGRGGASGERPRGAGAKRPAGRDGDDAARDGIPAELGRGARPRRRRLGLRWP